MTGITIPVNGDTSDLESSLDGAKADLSSLASAADEAAAIIDSSFSAAASGLEKMDKAAEAADDALSSVGDGADAVAGNATILAGALGDIGGGLDAVGLGGFNKVLEGTSTALMFAAGVSDTLSLATQAVSLAKAKDTIATVANGAANIASSTASKAAAAAQWALNAALSANPIGLVVLAVAALVAGFVVAYQKSETFRDIVNGALGTVKNVASDVAGFFTNTVPAAFHKVTDAAGSVLGWAKSNWPLLLAILTGPIGLAVLAIAKNWDNIKEGASAVKEWVVGKFNDLLTFATRLPSRMGSALGGLFDGLKSAFLGAVNFVIDKWNSFELKIDLPKVLGGGSIAIGTPNIPHLASGGIVTGPTLALIGEGKHDEAVIPLDGRTLGGNTYHLTVVAPVGASSADIGRELTKHIDSYERAGGRRRAA